MHLLQASLAMDTIVFSSHQKPFIVYSRTLIVTFGPHLSKKLFPVSRVGKKKSQSGGRESFFFPNFIFNKLECTGGKSKKKEENFESRKYKVPVCPL